MHAYDKCGMVWEREIAPDHIQWGWCTRERGHHGPHGHASEIVLDAMHALEVEARTQVDGALW